MQRGCNYVVSMLNRRVMRILPYVNGTRRFWGGTDLGFGDAIPDTVRAPLVNFMYWSRWEATNVSIEKYNMSVDINCTAEKYHAQNSSTCMYCNTLLLTSIPRWCILVLVRSMTVIQANACIKRTGREDARNHIPCSARLHLRPGAWVLPPWVHLIASEMRKQPKNGDPALKPFYVSSGLKLW